MIFLCTGLATFKPQSMVGHAADGPLLVFVADANRVDKSPVALRPRLAS